MYKSYKFRIYPTIKQSILIDRHIGSVRFLYNLALETKKNAYSLGVNLTKSDLQIQLKDLKKDFIWLNEINSQSLQSAIYNLDLAYHGFFKHGKSFPKFKKKKNLGSFSIPQSSRVEFGLLSVPKFREGIKINIHRNYQGKIKTVTISKNATGKYFASILCLDELHYPAKKDITFETTLGLDLGIKSFLVSSDAEIVGNPKFLNKSLKKIKFVQSRYSNHRSYKNRLKLAKLHEKVKNQRKDFLHKISSDLINNHNSIAIENLNVKGMIKNRSLSKAISDTSWGIFINMIKYKAKNKGVNILEIGRFEPTSKMCSSCNHIKKDLTLNDRNWICENCNEYHDRDLNAAINIKKIGLLCAERILKNQIELPEIFGAKTFENELTLAHTLSLSLNNNKLKQ